MGSLIETEMSKIEMAYSGHWDVHREYFTINVTKPVRLWNLNTKMRHCEFFLGQRK